MKKFCFITILLMLFLSNLTFSQTSQYPTYTIKQIQYVPDSLLALGLDSSPRVGDTVRVIGLVMVAPLDNPLTTRRPIMWAGARWQTYLVDTSDAEAVNGWVGLNVIQDDTLTHLTNMELLDTCQIVAITGVISEFGTPNRQTQINVLRTVPIEILGLKDTRPQPVEITLDKLATGSSINLVSGEKYEGQYVIIRNVITSNANSTTGTFNINDANGNSIAMHDQSGYFTKRAHKIINYEPPVNGSQLAYIRGVIGTGSTGYVIRPMYPGDIMMGNIIPPVISSVSRDKAVVTPNDDVTVYVKATDQDGQVISGKVYYRVNYGAYQTLNLTKFSGDTIWSATIPKTNVPDSAIVDYFTTVLDNQGNQTQSPFDTSRSRYFYFTLNRPLTIHDVQYAPYINGLGGYVNQRVTVKGVVTADTSDLRGDGGSVSRRVYIQDGRGPWRGIWVRGTIADPLKKGDYIEVSGKVFESNSHTSIDSITQINILSTNEPLPDPVVVPTGDVGGKTKGTISAEQWEGVLVRHNTLTITRENADGNPGPDTTTSRNFGEILVNDGSGDLRVELQEGPHMYHNNWTKTLPPDKTFALKQGYTINGLIGVMFFSFSNYKLVPRTNADFIGVQTSVEKDHKNPISYSLSQNYPNPFNPYTTITYNLSKATNVTLKVYDLLGREVKKLVENKKQNAGEYKIIFDAGNLPSGVYLYTIQTDDYTSTKKMVLMK